MIVHMMLHLVDSRIGSSRFHPDLTKMILNNLLKNLSWVKEKNAEKNAFRKCRDTVSRIQKEILILRWILATVSWCGKFATIIIFKNVTIMQNSNLYYLKEIEKNQSSKCLNTIKILIKIKIYNIFFYLNLNSKI